MSCPIPEPSDKNDIDASVISNLDYSLQIPEEEKDPDKLEGWSYAVVSPKVKDTMQKEAIYVEEGISGYEIFNLYFSEEFFEMVLEHTNANVDRKNT